jgi:hypothetical protein
LDQARAYHYRKAGFLRAFEKVVTGMTSEPGPNFLGKACARWAPPECLPGRAERGMRGCRHPGTWWNAR